MQRFVIAGSLNEICICWRLNYSGCCHLCLKLSRLHHYCLSVFRSHLKSHLVRRYFPCDVVIMGTLIIQAVPTCGTSALPYTIFLVSSLTPSA